jgi:hypothetical protein
MKVGEHWRSCQSVPGQQSSPSPVSGDALDQTPCEIAIDVPLDRCGLDPVGEDAVDGVLNRLSIIT